MGFLFDDVREETSAEFAPSIADGQDATNEGTKHEEKGSKKRASASFAEMKRLYEKHGDKCALSGAPITCSYNAIDHITPTSRGGSNLIENIQFLHPIVNAMKGDMPQENFIALCCMIADKSRGLIDLSEKSPERLWYEYELWRIRDAIGRLTELVDTTPQAKGTSAG